MGPEQIRTAVHQFVRKNFMFDDKQTLGDDQSLLNSGVVDSTGILELISFLEESCQVKFNDNELVADNFDSVNKISAFMSQKILQAAV